MNISPVKVYPYGTMITKVYDTRTQAKREQILLNMALNQAADKADLNTTERLAINKAFFPDGNGLVVFPKGKTSADFVYYPIDKRYDEFESETSELKIPENIKQHSITWSQKSDKGSFQENLDRALKKLYLELNGNL